MIEGHFQCDFQDTRTEIRQDIKGVNGTFVVCKWCVFYSRWMSHHQCLSWWHSEGTLVAFRCHSLLLCYYCDAGTTLIRAYFVLFKIWNTKSWECLHTHKSVSRASEVPVNNVIPLPQHPEHFVVCNHSNTVVVLNMRGQVRRLPHMLIEWILYKPGNHSATVDCSL